MGFSNACLRCVTTGGLPGTHPLEFQSKCSVNTQALFGFCHLHYTVSPIPAHKMKWLADCPKFSALFWRVTGDLRPLESLGSKSETSSAAARQMRIDNGVMLNEGACQYVVRQLTGLVRREGRHGGWILAGWRIARHRETTRSPRSFFWVFTRPKWFWREAEQTVLCYDQLLHKANKVSNSTAVIGDTTMNAGERLYVAKVIIQGQIKCLGCDSLQRFHPALSWSDEFLFSLPQKRFCCTEEWLMLSLLYVGIFTASIYRANNDYGSHGYVTAAFPVWLNTALNKTEKTQIMKKIILYLMQTNVHILDVCSQPLLCWLMYSSSTLLELTSDVRQWFPDF